MLADPIPPLPHQLAAIDFLQSTPRALLADAMGLCKTSSALRALEPDARAVVVPPAGLVHVWEDECARFRPDLRVKVAEAHEELRAEPGEVVICPYTRVSRRYAPLCHPVTGDLVPPLSRDAYADQVLIVDEAHRVKSTSAERSRLVMSLARVHGRAWFLTGTPVPSSPEDLWGLFFALGAHREALGHASLESFARAVGGFKVRLKNGRSFWRWPVYGEATPERARAGISEVQERLRPFVLRRTKEEVLSDLPETVRRAVRVDLASTKLRADLDALGVEWSELLERDELPPFSAFSSTRAALARAVVPAVLEEVERHEEVGRPIVVFSAHRFAALALASREGWSTITGDVSSEERARRVRAFQAGDISGLALTIGAGSEGLTLTRASDVLFCDRAWTPGENAQAEDRVRRIGQKSSSVQITDIVADHPVTRRVQEILTKKATLPNLLPNP